MNITNPLQLLRDVKLGKNVKIYGAVNIYECEIGDNTKIGAFVEIQKNVRVGENCKISSHSFLCEGVVIENGVFIGHNVCFTNDLFPRATTPSGELQTASDWQVLPTVVRNYASIGSGATILPNLEIGQGAMVGAGAVVTRSVPARKIVAGNPARIIGEVPDESSIS